MELYRYYSIVLLSGIARIKCVPLAKNDDVNNPLIHPCGPREPVSLPTGFSPFFLEPPEVGKRDMLIDVYRYMKETSHQLETLMSRYREESESSRFTHLMGHRNVKRLNGDSKTSSSFFRAFTENLQLDYAETSRAWLYLSNFRSDTANSLNLDRLKSKTMQILCRLSEMIDDEGEELSPPVSNSPLYGTTDDQSVMMKNEYDILHDMNEYLKQKISLYCFYKNNI